MGSLRWILLSFFFSSASAQVLQGRVVHFKGGLPHAIVVLNDSLRQTTDLRGRFNFLSLAPGSHKLRVTHAHYKPVEMHVEIMADTTLQDILLEESIYELGEVLVSENRRERARRENALHVEAVSEEFIRKKMGGSLMETLDQLPGVNAMAIGSGQSKPQIRGLGFNQVVVVDGGVKHEGQQWGADHGLEIDQLAAGSVEILKGAASYLYGSDALGGVIRVNPPLPPPLHSMNLNFNSAYMSNSRSITHSLNFNLRQHAWYADARVTLRDYGDYRVPAQQIYVYDYAVELPGGYVRNSAGQERNVHATAGRITEKYQTRVHLSNVYSISGFFANAHGLEPRQVDAAEHDASRRDILLPRQQVNHFKLLSNTVLYRNHHELTLDAAYQRNLRHENSPYVSHGFMPPVHPNDINPNLERKYDKQVVTAHLRHKMGLHTHELTLGGNYEYQENEIGGWGFVIPAFAQHQAGLVVYDKWTLGTNTLVHGALRYDFGQISVREYTDWFVSDPGGTSAVLTRAQALTRTFQSATWTLGAQYTLGKTEFKLNTGSSFRMPLAKELAANGVNYHYFRYEKGNAELSPERSYQADLGIFYQTKQLELTLTPFCNYFSNYIYLNPTAGRDYLYGAGNQVFEYRQSRVLRYGGEVLLRYRPTQAWTAEISGEYLYNRQLSGDKAGFNLPFSPPPGGSARVTWQPGKPYLELNITHALKQASIVPPEKVTPAYTLLGMAGGTDFSVAGQTWSLSLQVSNLLNTRYLNHTSFYRLIDLPESGRNLTVHLKIPVSFAI